MPKTRAKIHILGQRVPHGMSCHKNEIKYKKYSLFFTRLQQEAQEFFRPYVRLTEFCWQCVPSKTVDRRCCCCRCCCRSSNCSSLNHHHRHHWRDTGSTVCWLSIVTVCWRIVSVVWLITGPAAAAVLGLRRWFMTSLPSLHGEHCSLWWRCTAALWRNIAGAWAVDDAQHNVLAYKWPGNHHHISS